MPSDRHVYVSDGVRILFYTFIFRDKLFVVFK